MEEQARTLNAYLKGSYGPYSGNAAYDYAFSRKDTHLMIFFVMEQTTSNETLHVDSFEWERVPGSETLEDSDAGRLEQFVRDYGSHYIQSLQYGFRIAIR